MDEGAHLQECKQTILHVVQHVNARASLKNSFSCSIKDRGQDLYHVVIFGTGVVCIVARLVCSHDCGSCEVVEIFVVPSQLTRTPSTLATWKHPFGKTTT